MKKIHNYVFQQHFTYQKQNAESFINLNKVMLFAFQVSLLFVSRSFLRTSNFSAWNYTPCFSVLFFFCTSSILFHVYFLNLILCFNIF